MVAVAVGVVVGVVVGVAVGVAVVVGVGVAVVVVVGVGVAVVVGVGRRCQVIRTYLNTQLWQHNGDQGMELLETWLRSGGHGTTNGDCTNND